MKSVRCMFGKHDYSLTDMVVKYNGVDCGKWQYVVKVRCIRCGKVRNDCLEIPMPPWIKDEKS